MSHEANLDITSDTCPITFVRAKLKLEKMQAGELLRIRLMDGEALVNVPRSLIEHGHQVLERRDIAGGVVEILVRRGVE